MQNTAENDAELELLLASIERIKAEAEKDMRPRVPIEIQRGADRIVIDMCDRPYLSDALQSAFTNRGAIKAV